MEHRQEVGDDGEGTPHWRAYLQAAVRREEERQMALGVCFRPGGGDCQYEYACIRCPFLHVDPARWPLLLETELDALRRLREAEQRGWLGEVRALEDTLDKIADKKEQVRQAGAQG